jgi:hypothetical protein
MERIPALLGSSPSLRQAVVVPIADLGQHKQTGPTPFPVGQQDKATFVGVAVAPFAAI